MICKVRLILIDLDKWHIIETLFERKKKINFGGVLKC